MKKSILYSIIAFIAGFSFVFYKNPKPIESIRQVVLIVAETIGSLLGAFVISAIIILLLMVFIKQLRKEFWKITTGCMLWIVILYILVELISILHLLE